MLTLALVLLAIGAIVGRWQVLPVRSAGDGVGYGSGTLVMVTPVSARSIESGDVLFVNVSGQSRGLRRVDALVDSWQRTFEIRDEKGEPETVQLPPTVWRVSRSVPYAGIPFNLLVGVVQAVLLVIVGLVLIAGAEVARSRAERRAERAYAPEGSPAEPVVGVTPDTEAPSVSGSAAARPTQLSHHSRPAAAQRMTGGAGRGGCTGG